MSDTGRWTVEVQEDENGDAMIELPPEALRAAGLQAGDTIKWTQLDNGAWSITKAEPTELVLVEAVSVFRMRYVVEVPVGKSQWALDTVVMQEAVEFSQKHLDETIVSHRVVGRDEALALCRADNGYAAPWSDDKLVETFFTPQEVTR